ncbi:MAG: class I SAM-dependent DNA methyltransferase, partial [Prevotella sp.]|nr:class I SAM-dependent DNA methyltransferase [Prevotella sp.]
AKNEHLSKEMQVSMQAGEIVGRIYEALLKSLNPNYSSNGEGNKYSQEQILHALNQLCVQIVFCLYAEDAGVFNHDQFHYYLSRFEARDMRRALINLFEILDTPYNERDPYLEEDLAAFPYVNGGLFSNYSPLPSERGKVVRLIPQFTEELKQTLLQNASLDFDWSEISPTIFGAVFESTLNPETRRSGGMHYTSIENIHKVIDPLFLNDLRRELDDILEEKVEKQRQKKLDAYQNRLASLTFLDPACGSGNFLTETYLSLRRLENEAIRERYHGQAFLGFEEVNPIKVSIQQFYGIEINDFAVTVATTALWISEAQMLAETEKIIHRDIDFLPLKSYTNIKEGNALRVSWNEWEDYEHNPTIITDEAYIYPKRKEESTMVSEPIQSYERIDLYADKIVTSTQPKEPTIRHIQFDYIIGNPPFVGYSMQSKEQKDDILSLFLDRKGKPFKSAGKIDYVAGWYYQASKLMKISPKTRTALVSTNSITQGEQVVAIWKPLKELFGIHIDFAHRTFRWDSEASQKAHVHCVIIGFSTTNQADKKIYDGERIINADNINGYLINAEDIFIESRKVPLCDVPLMTTGNRPADGGHLIIEADDYTDFIKSEPSAIPYIKRLFGAVEFINNKKRYCLWLKGVSPKELRQMPKVMNRIELCRDDRLSSPDEGRRKLAFSPHLFRETNNP